MGFVKDAWEGITGKTASKAAKKAAGVSAGATREATSAQVEAQREALEYLKEREAIPRQFREGALTQLGGFYGLEGGEGSQADLITRAQASPLYGALIGGKEAGEESILRSAAATGGLRSGNVQSALYDYNTQLQNQSLLQAYNQQLSGLSELANLPSSATQIASSMTGIGQTQAQGIARIGQTQAQGITAGAQAGQVGLDRLLGLGMQAGAMFI